MWDLLSMDLLMLVAGQFLFDSVLQSQTFFFYLIFGISNSPC